MHGQGRAERRAQRHGGGGQDGPHPVPEAAAGRYRHPGLVPDSAGEQRASAAARMRRTAETARRREALTQLRVAEATVAYAAAQLSNGLSRDQARQAMVELAGELDVLAGALRHLARLDRGERMSLARAWTGLGYSRVEVARRLGCSERTVWRWTGQRPG